MELLVLDEPTSGLDPLMERVFQEEIEAERTRGRSILLSSHILSEAEALADRVSIIRDGVVVESGTLDQLRHRTRTTVRATLERAPETLAEFSLMDDAHLDGRRIRGAVEAGRIGEAMALLGRYGIAALTVSPPSLEDLLAALRPGEPGAGRHRRRWRRRCCCVCPPSPWPARGAGVLGCAAVLLAYATC